MKRGDRKSFLVVSLLFLCGVLGTWRFLEARGEKREKGYARCAEEVNGMVAEFLRTNEVARNDHAEKGALVRVTGSGYATPGPWNLEGQFYLSMQRVAAFERGTEQVQIMMFDGEERSVFMPQHSMNSQPGRLMIYVTVPEL